MRILALAVLCLAGCNLPVPVLPPMTGSRAALAAAYTDCAGATVLGNSSQFRLRVLANGVAELDQTIRASDGLPAELTVTAGAARRVVIEALDANGTVIAIARSEARTVKDGDTLAWSVRFRPVDAFTPTCGPLGEARSGHSAVTLADGTVFIAGGLAVNTALFSTERFDPVKQTFAPSRAMGIAAGGSLVTVSRAFGTATLLANGQVVLWGGESYATAGITPSSVILVYDPSVDDYGAVQARVSPVNVPRSHHAALRSGSDVVVLGGTTRASTLIPAAAIERISSADFKPSIEGQLTVARTDAAIAQLDANRAVVAGGYEEPGRIDVLELSAPMTVHTGTLATARRAAAATALARGVLVVGGVDFNGNTLGSTELVGADATVQPGPMVAARAEACAVTLEDGRALIFGGLDGTAPVASAELVDSMLKVTQVAFPGAARVHPSCTLLGDGSVLIAGGQGVSGALADAFLFTPR